MEEKTQLTNEKAPAVQVVEAGMDSAKHEIKGNEPETDKNAAECSKHGHNLQAKSVDPRRGILDRLMAYSLTPSQTSNLPFENHHPLANGDHLTTTTTKDGKKAAKMRAKALNTFHFDICFKVERLNDKDLEHALFDVMMEWIDSSFKRRFVALANKSKFAAVRIIQGRAAYQEAIDEHKAWVLEHWWDEIQTRAAHVREVRNLAALALKSQMRERSPRIDRYRKMFQDRRKEEAEHRGKILDGSTLIEVMMNAAMAERQRQIALKVE